MAIDKKRYPRNPLRNPAQKKLRTVFGDLPVVDATEPLRMFPTPLDFKRAEPLNPHKCGFARCAERAVGASSALVFANTTYFDHVGKDGVKRIYRYRNSRPVKEVVYEFDLGHKVDTSRAFVFLPPAQSYTLARQRAKGKRLRAAPRGRAVLNEWMARDRLRRIEADLDHWKEKVADLAKQRPQAKALNAARQQVSQLTRKLREVRSDVQEKATKASTLRVRPFRAKATVGHASHHLRIRNGTGFMNTLR